MKSILVVLLLLFTSVAAAMPEKERPGKNIIDLHLNAKMSTKECLECHESILKGVTNDNKFKTYHRVHLESKLNTPKNCTECHWKTDLRDNSAATLRKQVDPQLCNGCHSGGIKGANVLYSPLSPERENLVEFHKNAGKTGSKECLNCHEAVMEGVTARKEFKVYHRVHLESKLMTPKNCTECHWSVDLRDKSAAALRRQVDPQLCTGCHSGGVKGAKTFYIQ